MKTHTVFLMLYFLGKRLNNYYLRQTRHYVTSSLAFQHVNAFHLDGIKKIDGKNLKNLDGTYREPSNIRTLAGTTEFSLNASESRPLSDAKLNADGLHIRNDVETKVHDRPWTTAKKAVSGKSSNLLSTASHPKRQSVNHPTWHKISKEPHKFSAFDNSRENGFNGFDVVVVDIPSSYSRMRWEKPRINGFASPLLRYAPMTRSPSIFDLLLGLDSVSENVLTQPDGMENEVYFQPSMDDPSWNRHLSFGKLINPIQQKAMNGNRFSKDVSAIPFFGKLTEPAKNCTCICEERRKFP